MTERLRIVEEEAGMSFRNRTNTYRCEDGPLIYYFISFHFVLFHFISYVIEGDPSAIADSQGTLYLL